MDLNLPFLTEWCCLVCFGPSAVMIILLCDLCISLPLGLTGSLSRSLKLILLSVDSPPAFLFIPCLIPPVPPSLDELPSSLQSSVSESEDATVICASTISSSPVLSDFCSVFTPATVVPLTFFVTAPSTVAIVSMGKIISLECFEEFLSATAVKFCPDFPEELGTFSFFLVPIALLSELHWISVFSWLLVSFSNDPGSTESPLLFFVFPFLLSLWSSESLVPLSSSWCNFGRLLLLAFLSLPLCLVSVWFFLFCLRCSLSPGSREQYSTYDKLWVLFRQGRKCINPKGIGGLKWPLLWLLEK